MKRDMNIIRGVLMRIEESQGAVATFTGDDAQHVALLVDAGFVEAHILKMDGRGVVRAVVERLTWSGHDFLDAMRDILECEGSFEIWFEGGDDTGSPGRVKALA